jgi:hypothetical protein
MTEFTYWTHCGINIGFISFNLKRLLGKRINDNFYVIRRGDRTGTFLTFYTFGYN